MKKVFCVVLLVCSFTRGAVWQLSVEQAAEAVQRPAGAPKYSDVCMSSRWKRPIDSSDTHDTLRDAAAFHATRIEWCYCFDAEWIKQVKAKGYFYGGTLNACLADQHPWQSDNLTYFSGRIHDRKGRLITAPWMSMWDPVPYWGCVNAPEYRKIYLDCAKVLIEAGADAIQTDDPADNLSALRWGGCFCEYCVMKAAVKCINIENKLELAKFTENSVRDFYNDMHKEMDKIAGRHVSVSSNNFGGTWTMPYDMFDYGIAEYENPTPERISALAAAVKKLGKAQTITLRNENTSTNRKTISLCYCTGMQMLCPYDVYLKSTAEGSKRFFIPAAKVADIYGFVRANAEYLDGYEDAFATGGEIADTRYGELKPLVVMYKGMYGFVRAKPEKPDAPVVIHLLDWIGAGTPFKIQLGNSRFFGGKPFDAKLLMLTEYNDKLHQQCELAKDYSPLSKTVELKLETVEDTTTIAIPAINPWAMVVLTPGKAE